MVSMAGRDGKVPADLGRILDASRVPEFAVISNRTIMRHGYMDAQQVQRALQHKVGRFMPGRY